MVVIQELTAMNKVIDLIFTWRSKDGGWFWYNKPIEVEVYSENAIKEQSCHWTGNLQPVNSIDFLLTLSFIKYII